MAVRRNEDAVQTCLSQDSPLDVNSDRGKIRSGQLGQCASRGERGPIRPGTQLTIVACYQALCYHLHVKVELQCYPLGDLRSLSHSVVDCTCHACGLLRVCAAGPTLAASMGPRHKQQSNTQTGHRTVPEKCAVEPGFWTGWWFHPPPSQRCQSGPRQGRS